MLQSQLFTKTRREAPKDEESVNAQLLIRAGFIDKTMAGVYSFLPLGLRVLRKIENIIREEMEAVGGQEILMPALQPKANWEKTGRWGKMEDLFRFTSYYTKTDYALGPTHEEIVSPLLKKFIFSYKDLPVYVFQIQDKFRDEARAKSGLLRGREFVMKDLYSFHKDEKDLGKYYETVKTAYFKVFERLGFGNLTYLTFASGGTFSKYSHEFQTLSDAGEDTIYICDKCRVAVNKEIIKEQKVCPECGSENLKEEKAIEVGNIFKLNTKYSEPFDLKYRDEDGEEKEIYMGCYGIGPNRLMGTAVEVSHDDKGIIWPESISPFKIHLLNLGKDAEKEKCDQLYYNLQKIGMDVLYDDRIEAGPGEKLVDSDLMGIPWRLIISEKTQDKIEVKRRGEKEIKLASEKELAKILQ
ncbi:MAG: His/Gly/Thr/Pro-type tRNA ligase C-terminal domain-containing protein [Candidatus Wolfebacteria bacterium]|nr:His/Gly/Thr/Pro-type tRNA ligase C-terminal domain-containing protein [Candidatus Wolfebacteria bacterium]